MSQKKNVQPDELKKVESALGKSEAFIEKYIKELSIGVLVIALLVTGIMIYRNKYQAPRELKAQEQIYKGEMLFAQDSFMLAINGDGIDYLGFKNIVDEYSGSKTANLAKGYMGVCYFKLGDYNSAITNLKDFDADDELISPVLTGLIGDCYVELGDINNAISFFEKAAKSENSLVSPIFLKKAAIAYESQGKYDKAIANYTTIRDKYFNSPDAMDIDKYIDRAKALQK